MSHGALSTETHEAVAIAMNRIQGKSNSGEEEKILKDILPMKMAILEIVQLSK